MSSPAARYRRIDSPYASTLHWPALLAGRLGRDAKPRSCCGLADAEFPPGRDPEKLEAVHFAPGEADRWLGRRTFLAARIVRPLDPQRWREGQDLPVHTEQSGYGKALCATRGLALEQRVARLPATSANCFVAQTSQSAVSQVSQPAGASSFPTRSDSGRAADLEVGDTAGWETCATDILVETFDHSKNVRN